MGILYYLKTDNLTKRKLMSLIFFYILKVKPPAYSIHNIEEANQVFEDLYQSRITGRAILKLNHSHTTDNWTVTYCQCAKMDSNAMCYDVIIIIWTKALLTCNTRLCVPEFLNSPRVWENLNSGSHPFIQSVICKVIWCSDKHSKWS